MIENTTKTKKDYIAQLKREFVGPKKDRCAYVSVCKDAIADHFPDNPNPSYDEIVSVLGAPSDLLVTFDADYYRDLILQKKKNFIILQIVLLALIVGISISSFALVKSAEDNDIVIDNNFDKNN